MDRNLLSIIIIIIVIIINIIIIIIIMIIIIIITIIFIIEYIKEWNYSERLNIKFIDVAVDFFLFVFGLLF